jgi:hypothetical protein
MLNHWNSKAVLLRTEEDGTLVYRKNHKILRVTRLPSEGFYPPGGRRALYKDKPDPRNTTWFAEAVRERRQQGFKAGVRPGPQSL